MSYIMTIYKMLVEMATLIVTIIGVVNDHRK